MKCIVFLCFSVIVLSFLAAVWRSYLLFSLCPPLVCTAVSGEFGFLLEVLPGVL